MIDQPFGGVSNLDLIATLLIFISVLLGLPHHAVDFILAQRRAARNSHGLLFTRRHVFSRHVDDSVGIDIEGDLDLRDATRCRW